MKMENKFLFNFAASYSGGGFKRLYEYSRVLDANGGAWFIVHPNCKNLAAEFPNNHYFVVKQRGYQRLVNDCGYLAGILKQVGRPDLYYSYGIPIYAKVGRVNWFHLSNVLPLASRNIPLSAFDRLKMRHLGSRIKHNYANADVISAESNYSLGLIGITQTDKLFLSVNGSNDELATLNDEQVRHKSAIATVLGTYRYKALNDSWHVFEMLRQRNRKLKLVIIGHAEYIPEDIRQNPHVIVRGLLKRSDVIACLRESTYYISTTHIENSYNAASEGIFLADESYISDIGPHRELLRNMPFDLIAVPNMSRPVLRVARKSITGANLKPWEDVVAEMVSLAQARLGKLSDSPFG